MTFDAYPNIMAFDELVVLPTGVNFSASRRGLGLRCGRAKARTSKRATQESG
jgi:hypothetical protein